MKTLKKGFTIVELVIVIAVIAILAAVLIPTFSGVVGNANKSAALQTARSTLTNALNMSNTAALTGTNSDNVYKTVFLADGYAFEYQGNSLIDMDYPGADSTIPTLKKGTGTSQNFNALLIASQNLVETYSTTAEAANAKAPDGGAWYANDSEGTDAKYYAKGDDVAGKYKLASVKIEKTLANIIYTASDLAGNTSDTATSTDASEIAYISVNKDKDGKYTLTLDSDVSVYINSDFSKKVVVFTTFAN